MSLVQEDDTTTSAKAIVAMLFVVVGLLGWCRVASAQHVNCFPSEQCAKSIVSATYQEFPEVIAARPTVEASIARGEELLRRIIWHLQQSNVQAGRQRNPSGLLSADKASIFWDGAWHAVDIATNFDVAGVPMSMVFAEVPLPNHVADTGIADEGGPPPPPNDDVEALLQRIAELEAQVRSLQDEVGRLNNELTAAHAQIALRDHTIDQQAAEIERLKAIPAPTGCAVTPGWVTALGVRCHLY